MNKKTTSILVLGMILSAAGLTPTANASQGQDVEAAEQQASGVLNVILTEEEKAQLADYVTRGTDQMTAQELAEYEGLLKKATKMVGGLTEHWG
jgi:hypothetical protein